MSQSDTPRLQRYTVEALGGYTVQATTTVDGEWVRYKDAHKLERELAEQTKLAHTSLPSVHYTDELIRLTRELTEAHRALAAERDQALEEAAKVCDNLSKDTLRGFAEVWMVEVAKRIRALKAARKEGE